eukprot:7538259-Pyramimonas_sp.AAC.1
MPCNSIYIYIYAHGPSPYQPFRPSPPALADALVAPFWPGARPLTSTVVVVVVAARSSPTRLSCSFDLVLKPLGQSRRRRRRRGRGRGRDRGRGRSPSTFSSHGRTGAEKGERRRKRRRRRR